MTSKLRIGIDFDNTIIAYDEVFCATAKRRALIGAEFFGSKQAVRDAVRLLPDGELAWMRLQGEVYGKGIGGANMIAGVDAFLRRCNAEGCTVVVVSHKTQYGHYDPDRVDLRHAALGWMKAQGLFNGDFGVGAENVYFEGTRSKKISRIAALGLTHFVDDLEEVLTDPSFPPTVQRILFAEPGPSRSAAYIRCGSWTDIERQVFGEAVS